MGQGKEAEAKIVIVVGLGNPGKEYKSTRHNVGFQVIDRLAQLAGITLQERKFKASWGSGALAGRKISLVQPLAFMNRSGEPVGEILRYFAIGAEQMLVVHDDLDLPCGRLRLVRGGGAGGHRGVLSLIQHLGGRDFPRLKMGIGRPVHGEAVESYVLRAPYPEQQREFAEMIERAAEATQEVLRSGLAAAMDKFNRREPQG